MDEEAAGALGLAKGTVALAAGDSRWAGLYQLEEQRLRAAIGGLVVDIQHFGSTAIPAIKAKPILDIMVGLRQFSDGTMLVEPLATLGYDYVGTDMVPNDHLFGKGAARTHIVHAVTYGGHHWTRNLRFRDRMRADPALAASYEALKVQLAARFASQRAAYTAAKREFIDGIADA